MKYCLFLLLIFSPTVAKAEFTDVFKATGRIWTYYKAESVPTKSGKTTFLKNSCGSGVVYEEDEDHYYLLTAGHVLEPVSKFKVKIDEEEKEIEFKRYAIGVEFFLNGFRKNVVLAELINFNYTPQTINDLAILSIKKSYFRTGPKPMIIRLAPKEYQVNKESQIISCGCAKGAWPTAWQGHVTKNFGTHFLFNPSPYGGRSGSAIFSKDATNIIGIIIWKDNSNRGGTAIGIKDIYRQINEFKNK